MGYVLYAHPLVFVTEPGAILKLKNVGTKNAYQQVCMGVIEKYASTKASWI